MSLLDQKEILITGGTGSLGNALVEELMKNHPNVRGIRIFSRDEAKHQAMKSRFKKRVAYIIGDVRDAKAVERASRGVDVIIHAAALKHVDQGEDNPIEVKRTNVDGAENVIEAAVRNKVSIVMNVSTDKAVSPTNIYGASKLMAEKIFCSASVYSRQGQKPIFASCRYGNVIGSRGSVIELWSKQIPSGNVDITDPNMTRFWIELPEVANFLLDRISARISAIEYSKEQGFVYVPKMKSMNMQILLDAMCKLFDNNCKLFDNNIAINKIGIRPGEKIHEELISKIESRRTIDCGNVYKIFPKDVPSHYADHHNCKESEYTSNTNQEWWSREEMVTAIKKWLGL